MEPNQVHPVAFAMSRHLQQIVHAVESRLTGQIERDVVDGDRRDRVDDDVAVLHRVATTDLHMRPRPDIVSATLDPATPTKHPVQTKPRATFVPLFLTLLLLAVASVKTLGAVAALTPHVAGWNGGSYAAWALSPYVALAVLGCGVRRASIASVVVLGGTLIAAGPAIGIMSGVVRAPSADAQLGFGLGVLPYGQWLVVILTGVLAMLLIAKWGVE